MKKMMFFFGIIAIISCNKQNTKSENYKSVNEQDIQHIREAYALGLFFINIAQIAQKKATSNEVKEIARRSTFAYKQINSDLITLAAEKTISLPEDITSEQKSDIQKLSNMQGISFDKVLIAEIKNYNRNALTLFQQMYIKSEDDDISYWALNKLSRLHDNLDSAIIVNKKFKNK